LYVASLKTFMKFPALWAWIFIFVAESAVIVWVKLRIIADTDLLS
jgi:hypothetical protein